VTEAELRRAPGGELEEVLRAAPFGPPPAGTFRGRFLCWLRRVPLHVRAMDELLFRAVTFGLDFDRGAWWFVTPRLQAGAFDATRGPSRWRDGVEVMRLRYDRSRLPRPFRAALYDEVKPLSADVCLGIGGLNADAGRGDHFLFALAR
jgi:hypothetical protein